MWVTTSRSCGVHEQARARAPASLSEGLSRPHLRSLNQTAASLVHRLPPATPPTPAVTRQQPLQGLRPQAGRGVRDSYPPPAPGHGADRRRRPLRAAPLCVCLCSWLTKALAAERPVGVACSPRASRTPGTPPTCLCLIVTPDLRSSHLGEPRVSCTLSWSRGWKRRPCPSGLAVVHVRPRACVRTVPSARAPGRAPGQAGEPPLQSGLSPPPSTLTQLFSSHRFRPDGFVQSEGDPGEARERGAELLRADGILPRGAED